MWHPRIELEAMHYNISVHIASAREYLSVASEPKWANLKSI
jgi:hypothetical protein